MNFFKYKNDNAVSVLTSKNDIVTNENYDFVSPKVIPAKAIREYVKDLKLEKENIHILPSIGFCSISRLATIRHSPLW